MGYLPNQKTNVGFFVPTTNIWDVSRINEITPGGPDFKQLMVSLYQNINNIAVALNAKDTGLHDVTEFVNGKLFFNPDPLKRNQPRSTFRKVINIGAVGAGATTVAHGLVIGSTWTFTMIAGTGTNTTTNNYYPMPFAGAAGAYISLRLNATNVLIDNNSGVTFERCIVILEYLKN